MKTKNLLLRGVIVAMLVMAMVTSCKEDVEAQNDEQEVTLPATVLTSYEGALTYNGSAGQNVLTAEGTATISRTGDTYTISFSDGVPSVTGLRFVLDDGAYVTVGSDDSVAGISIDGEDLDIGVSSSGTNWMFSGEKS